MRGNDMEYGRRPKGTCLHGSLVARCGYCSRDKTIADQAARIAALEAALAEEKTSRAAAIEQAVEAEQTRWQDRLDWLHQKYGVDGSGCDSGDPLDLTDAEVHAAITLFENAVYDCAQMLAAHGFANDPTHGTWNNLRQGIQEVLAALAAKEARLAMATHFEIGDGLVILRFPDNGRWYVMRSGSVLDQHEETGRLRFVLCPKQECLSFATRDDAFDALAAWQQQEGR